MSFDPAALRRQFPLHAAFGLDASTRVSFAPYNDDADVDALLQGLAAARRILR